MAARTRGRRYAHLAAAFAVHAVLLGALALGVADHRPPPEPPPILLDLTPPLPVSRPPRALPSRPETPPPSPAPRAVARAAPQPAPVAKPAPPAPARPVGVRAGAEPIGPTGPIGTQAAIRASTGCESAEYLRLNPAEAARCEARDRRLWAANPKTYAAVSQEKKDFFDGACKRDDDWCLYRTGQGPYPGLLALGRKKKKSD